MKLESTRIKGWYVLNGKEIVVDNGAYVSCPKLLPSEQRYFRTYYKQIIS